MIKKRFFLKISEKYLATKYLALFTEKDLQNEAVWR